MKSRGYLADPLGMGATNLPAEIWLLVALIAAGTVVMCLSVLGAAVQYEHARSTLAGEVRELRKHYSLSYPDVIVPVDMVSDGESDRKAA